MSELRHRSTNAPTALAALIVLAVLCRWASGMVPGQALGQTPGQASAQARPEAAAAARSADSVATTAARIDAFFEAYWTTNGVTPANRADDAEYLRRVTLDIAGRPPTPDQVRAFLADPDPNKRRRVVDELLAGPGYLEQFTEFWRDVYLPEAAADRRSRLLAAPFELWLFRHLARGTPHDVLVRELLTAPLEQAVVRNSLRAGTIPEPSPLPFFTAKEASPENLAAALSRSVLGVRIECAQCHDHPFDEWKRAEFWSFAAFFGGLRRVGDGPFAPIREQNDRRELMVPDSKQVVQATYLDGTAPQWRPREGARAALARWATSAENPYFARAAANRLWGYFLGYGIVDPVDDFSKRNPASHAEVLDELATAFVRAKFDLRFLIRTITATRAYQLTSRQSHASQADPRHFARFALRALTPNQRRRTRVQITGRDPAGFGEESGGPTAAPRERPIGVLAALEAANGPVVTAGVNVETGPLIGGLAAFPADTGSKIDALYVAVLGRPPTSDERRRMIDFVDGNDRPVAAKSAKSSARGETERRNAADEALADVLWMLLNSSEFSLVH